MIKKVILYLIIFIFYNIFLNTNELAKFNNKEKEFYKYFNDWKVYIKKTKIQLSSNSKDYIENEQYNKIIKMGIIIVPILIKEIKNGEWMLYYALEKIIKNKPYNDDEILKYTSEQEKAKLWLKWWEKSN